MIRRDLPAVLDIENACFASPWSEDDFIQQLRGRNIIAHVAEAERDDICGFVVYELHRRTIEILDIAVHPDCQGGGIASQMVDKLKGKLNPDRRDQIQIPVRETNLTAQLFLRSQRFFCEDILPDIYWDTHESAYLFRFEI